MTSGSRYAGYTLANGNFWGDNMARELTVYGITAGIYNVPGGTGMLIRAAPGEISSTIKYFGGGSLEIVGAGGPSLSVGLTSSLAGTGYLLSSLEAFNFEGAAYYYLIATGATATAYFLKGLSQGF